jgi:hypothetical protein
MATIEDSTKIIDYVDKTPGAAPRYIIKVINNLNGMYYSSKLVNRRNIELGHFTINEHNDEFKMLEMTIGIDEEYQFKGHAKRLMNKLCVYLFENYPKKFINRNLYIDADGSGGFWDKVGMVENDDYDISSGSLVEGKGYEKCITFENLSKWAE